MSGELKGLPYITLVTVLTTNTFGLMVTFNINTLLHISTPLSFAIEEKCEFVLKQS